MRLITYAYNGEEAVGLVLKNNSFMVPIKSLGLKYDSMNELIDNITEDEMQILKDASLKSDLKKISFAEITKKAPIPVPKQDMICLGINYAEHAEESARFKKEAFEKDRKDAVYFSKRINEAVADGNYIDGHFDIVDSLDYECELAVIIGKDAKNVKKEDALDYIFGYTIINDVSARNLQTAHKQWYFGKSLDDFTPMGPWIVTKDEFCFPLELNICSKVNGEIRQNSNTKLMMTTIDEVIEELSQGMTLKKGTIIATGTPAGVGMGFVPPKFLKSGDVVQCEIEGIGILKNIIR